MEAPKPGAASLPENPYSFSGKGVGGELGGSGLTSALSSSDKSRVLVTRCPRNTVSLWTCSKLCAVCFVAGLVVGYTLKKRVRKWASRLLKSLRDD